jgi:hypothetical protein
MGAGEGVGAGEGAAGEGDGVAFFGEVFCAASAVPARLAITITRNDWAIFMSSPSPQPIQ